MDTPLTRSVAFVAMLTASAAAPLAQELWPTPEIAEIVKLEAPHTVAYGIRGEFGASVAFVGFGFPGANTRALDLTTSPARDERCWAALLEGMDPVVNVAGVLQPPGRPTRGPSTATHRRRCTAPVNGRGSGKTLAVLHRFTHLR